MKNQISEKEALKNGIRYFSHRLNVLLVKLDEMTIEELNKHLETLEREFVERAWFKKYRIQKEKMDYRQTKETDVK